MNCCQHLSCFFSSVRRYWLPISLIVVAVCLRCGVTAQIGDKLERITRPDTPTYLEPAQSWATGQGYSTTRRAPGFPAVAALVYRSGGDNHVLKWGLVAISLLTIGVIVVTGRLWRSWRLGWWSGAFGAWSITAIANAPMLLSDTLFAFMVALQWAGFVGFFRQRRMVWFVFAMLIAALGALIRPINGPWFLVGLTLLLFLPQWSWRKKFVAGRLGLIIFLLVILPWMSFNARRGAGFCIDTNTGAMLHQNGAALLAEVNGTSYEAEKQLRLRQMNALFADTQRFPDEASREKWRIAELKKLVLAHPVIFLKQQINPYILLPDAPTFLEICGLTQSDRGTLNVLRQHGLWAAVKFYFNGVEWVLVLLLPLLAITGLLYFCCATELVWRLKNFRHQWYILLMAAGFIEYYLFLPGAISAPRYQLPALPMATLLAALCLLRGERSYRQYRINQRRSTTV